MQLTFDEKPNTYIDGRTPLHLAVEHGKTELTKLLIENGSDDKLDDYKKELPIHAAAKYGEIDCLRLLIERKTNSINVQDDIGWAPLHFAAESGNPDCIQFLIDNDANVNATNNVDDTPLHVVGLSKLGTKDEKEKCCKILIKAGADLHAKSLINNSPLDLEFIKDFVTRRPELLDFTNS